ncbi:MAG: very short patch repair endonuclease [Coriobacteriia bacterium]|nr:very short patch repair endonuclease [Coriobacteriia bacterium]
MTVLDSRNDRKRIANVMRANRSRDTGPEMALRRALAAAGVRGYRLHWVKAPGRPDVAWPGRRVAVFVHGCFWHRCPACSPPLPKSNAEFWEQKFRRTAARDLKDRRSLEQRGWTVLVFWECQIRENVGDAVNSIAQTILAADARTDKHVPPAG